MKKLFAVSVAFLMLTSAFAGVNVKVLYSFNKTFPSAENVKWREDASGYFVSFTQAGFPSKAVYDNRGNFVYALRYYKEENLPASILLALRKKFTDKTISGVTEVSVPDNITYHITLEDAKSWYSVEATTLGDITIEKQFEKN